MAWRIVIQGPKPPIGEELCVTCCALIVTDILGIFHVSTKLEPGVAGAAGIAKRLLHFQSILVKVTIFFLKSKKNIQEKQIVLRGFIGDRSPPLPAMELH